MLGEFRHEFAVAAATDAGDAFHFLMCNVLVVTLQCKCEEMGHRSAQKPMRARCRARCRQQRCQSHQRHSTFREPGAYSATANRIVADVCPCALAQVKAEIDTLFVSDGSGAKSVKAAKHGKRRESTVTAGALCQNTVRENKPVFHCAGVVHKFPCQLYCRQ